MQIEKRVRELGRGKHVALDATLSADEEGPCAGTAAHESARDGKSWIEVTPGAAPGEEDGIRGRGRAG